MTRREVTGLLATALIFGVAAWFWLADYDARRNGIPLQGIYSGKFERHHTNSRFGSRRTTARVIIDFETPDGVMRSGE